MLLIVGLGNPGEKYIHTRHNLGFLVLDKIAEKREVDFRENQEALETNLDEKTKLIKPQTFMNESGRAVLQIKNYYKIDIDDIWLIYDDVDLEWGSVRMSFAGTSAGHKGVQSVIDSLDNENFWRIRIGIGRAENIPTEDWVLMRIRPEEMGKFEYVVDQIAELVIEYINQGIKEETIKIS